MGAREPLRIRPQTRVDRILSSSQRIDVGDRRRRGPPPRDLRRRRRGRGPGHRRAWRPLPAGDPIGHLPGARGEPGAPPCPQPLDSGAGSDGVGLGPLGQSRRPRGLPQTGDAVFAEVRAKNLPKCGLRKPAISEDSRPPPPPGSAKPGRTDCDKSQIAASHSRSSRLRDCPPLSRGGSYRFGRLQGGRRMCRGPPSPGEGSTPPQAGRLPAERSSPQD